MHASPPDRALLDRRARALAAPPLSPGGANDGAYLQFTLHTERCALEASLVCGTFRLTDFVPLPGAGAEVVGVTVWRGAILRILDLELVLGGARTGLDDRAMVIALGAKGPSLGLLVNALSSVGSLPNDPDQPSASVREGRPFVTRITAGAVQILDGFALLSNFG